MNLILSVPFEFGNIPILVSLPFCSLTTLQIADDSSLGLQIKHPGGDGADSNWKSVVFDQEALDLIATDTTVALLVNTGGPMMYGRPQHIESSFLPKQLRLIGIALPCFLIPTRKRFVAFMTPLFRRVKNQNMRTLKALTTC